MLPAEYKNENDETDSIRLDEQQTNNQSKGIKDYLSQKSDPIDADTQMDLISEDSEVIIFCNERNSDCWNNFTEIS